MKDNDKIDILVDKLGCSIEEAKQIIEDDYAIDHNEKLFELTAEQKKVAKEMTRVDSEKQKKKNQGVSKSRSKKVDDDKVLLVNAILDKLNEVATDVKATHEGREYTCQFNNKKFKISISQPRS
jgi:hypothetical protein